MEDPDFPSGWRECGVVSESYLLVENAAVRDLAYEVADRSGLGLERTFFDGRRYGLYMAATERGASHLMSVTSFGEYRPVERSEFEVFSAEALANANEEEAQRAANRCIELLIFYRIASD